MGSDPITSSIIKVATLGTVKPPDPAREARKAAEREAAERRASAEALEKKEAQMETTATQKMRKRRGAVGSERGLRGDIRTGALGITGGAETSKTILGA